MYAAGIQLPTDRARLFEDVTMALLTAERDRALPGQPIPFELLQRADEVAALEMCRSGSPVIHLEDLKRALASNLSTSDAHLADELMRILVEPIVLLVSPQPGLLTFEHRTFQEFYAAKRSLRIPRSCRPTSNWMSLPRS